MKFFLKEDNQTTTKTNNANKRNYAKHDIVKLPPILSFPQL